MISKFLNPLAKAIGVIAFAVLLNACSSDNNQAPASNPTKTVTQLPWEALTVPDLNGLSARIILDGNTASPIAMTIDRILRTATANIPGLSRASHTIQIEYRYTDVNGTLTIAQSPLQTVDLTGGSATIAIPSTAYVTAIFDQDNDGLSNAQELALGANPYSSACQLGTSLIGSCTI